MKLFFISGTIILIFILTLTAMMGKGGFKRITTLTGVYAVCRPGGYEAVCFLDADSSNGGLNCLPLSQVGSQCR